MSLSVTAAFDGGNIEVVSHDGDSHFDLEIRKDNQSDFYQWFYFRLNGAAGKRVTLAIRNAGGAAYPDGWPDYRALVSKDRRRWLRADTRFSNGTLTIEVKPNADIVWIAYFTPYSMERHADLIGWASNKPGVTVSSLGKTLDGQDLDCITVSETDAPERVIWMIARQHPGETMAEWWMEGMLERLVDQADPVGRALRRRCALHIVPNMNPDGSRRGHLRCNAAGVNLNREWKAPTLARSPEVYHVLSRMEETGVDFCLDVHGDEALPHCFIAGFEGIPSITGHQLDLLSRYTSLLAQVSPDFQTKVGYPKSKPGKANLSMCTNAVAELFGCLAMTLEMPFKDAIDNPDPLFGWSHQRSKRLGAACLEPLHALLDDLRA